MLILRQRQSVVSPEVQQFFDRADRPNMDITHVRAYTRLIDGLVAAGIWDDLDVLQVYATDKWQNAQLNLKDNRFTATVVNDPGVAGVPDGFTANLGFAGNGVNSYLDTGFRPGGSDSLDQLNTPQRYNVQDAHFVLWVANDEGFGDFTGAAWNFQRQALIWVNGLGLSGGPGGPGAYALINSQQTMPSSLEPNITFPHSPTSIPGFWTVQRWGGMVDDNLFLGITDHTWQAGPPLPGIGNPQQPFLLGALLSIWQRFHTRRYAMFSAGATLATSRTDHEKNFAYYRLLRSYMLAVGVSGPFWWG